MSHRLRALSLACVLAGLATVGAADLTDEAKKELKLFEGSWRCVRSEQGGRALPEGRAKGNGLVIEGAEIQTLWGGNNKGSKIRVLALDPKAKTIDIQWGPGAFTGQKQLGIYKLEKNKLEICWSAMNAKTRPKNFSTKPGLGNGHVHATYKRDAK